VTLSGEGADEVSDGDDNLLWTSFVAFCEERGVAVPDVAIRATNRIPLQRGLGSSSAAIVAGLVLARDLTGELVTETELVRIADRLEGHPDNVAPAIVGGLVACARDDAGVPIVRRIDPAPTLAPVVLVPSVRQSTDEARAVLPATMTRAEVAE
jgi:homoserine kinase